MPAKIIPLAPLNVLSVLPREAYFQASVEVRRSEFRRTEFPEFRGKISGAAFNTLLLLLPLPIPPWKFMVVERKSPARDEVLSRREFSVNSKTAGTRVMAKSSAARIYVYTRAFFYVPYIFLGPLPILGGNCSGIALAQRASPERNTSKGCPEQKMKEKRL